MAREHRRSAFTTTSTGKCPCAGKGVRKDSGSTGAVWGRGIRSILAQCPQAPLSAQRVGRSLADGRGCGGWFRRARARRRPGCPSSSDRIRIRGTPHPRVRPVRRYASPGAALSSWGRQQGKRWRADVTPTAGRWPACRMGYLPQRAFEDRAGRIPLKVINVAT